MKRIVSILLLLALSVSLFAGCKKNKENNGDSTNPPVTSPVDNATGDISNAKEYLISMYQKGGKTEVMELTKDLDLLSKVVVGGVSYDVSWTVSITEGSADSVKIGESTKENHVLLDINETPATDVQFTATATVKDAAGKTESASFQYKVAASATAGLTPEEIVEMAYALEEGEMMEGSSTLTGVVKMIKSAYDEAYNNITVIIQIGDLVDKRIECYRMVGEAGKDLNIGDTITVTGILKNYNGTIEFDQGCTLDNVVKGDPIAIPEDPKLIVEAAYALPKGESLRYIAELTGIITNVDSPYNADYQNITVTIMIEGCEDKPILVYRLKGDGADQLEIGDTITVSGYIINYNGTIEYTSGCALISMVKGDGTVPGMDPVEKPDTEVGIVDAAYALEEGKALPYSATLTGKVSAVNDAYNSEYGNITVTIVVPGREDKPIKCYRLKGSGADKLAVGDTITVTGTLKNYYGEIEFDFGCTLDNRVSGGNEPIKPETDPLKIIDAAYALKEDTDLGYDATLTGKVVKVDDAYNKEYKNITVTIQVSGREKKPIKCYRMKGDGVDKVAVGDTITVTGRLKNFGGTIEFDFGCQMSKRVSGGGTVIKQETDPLKIVDAAYALKEDTDLGYDTTLTGKVIKVDDAYNKEYKNITVTIQVSGREKKPIKCYRMKGDGVDKVAVGDTITVNGRLKNFGGTIEFDFGCQMTKRVSGGGTVIKQETDPLKIVDAAYALKEDTDLGYDTTLTGKVIKVDDAYNKEYKNITVTIQVSGREKKPIKCYRMKGDGVDKVAVGDTITVTGRLKNFGGTIEFDFGCQMTKRVSGGGTVIKQETDPLKIVDAAYALKEDTDLGYDTTLTGKVVKVDDAYNKEYKNITVTIQVSGREKKPIKCYRMKGDGVDKVAVGDTITVTGRLKNFGGTIEFDFGCQMSKRVSGGGTVIKQETDPLKIVDAAYALKEDTDLGYDTTLTGKVVSVDDAYNKEYQNITVTIQVTGREKKPIKCYRMKGDGVDKVAVGDTITVTGRLKNFGGTIEFDFGCQMSKRVSGGGTAIKQETDPAKIIDAAYKLEKDKDLGYDTTLTGKVTAIQSPYDTQYKNISVIIKVSGSEDQPLLCYRLKGDGVDKVAVGDTITVTGRLKNYNGTIEYVNCTMDKRVSGGGVAPTAPKDPKEIVDAAFALKAGEVLPYKATLTGKIIKINDKYNAQYSNITVTIEVEGSDGMKELKCFRLKGNGADKLKVGDVITVTGTIKNYTHSSGDSEIEFDAGCTFTK